MVYAIQLYLGFRNTARRDGAAGNITAKLGASAQWGTPTVESVPMRRSSDPGLVVTARFMVQADRDAAWVDLDNALGTGINGPVTGSRAWIHDCPHDENTGACVVSAERFW